MSTSIPKEPTAEPLGTLDASGAGDHDQPYRWGWRPRASVPYPFSTRQYARLLVLRSRVRDGLRPDYAADFTSAKALDLAA